MNGDTHSQPAVSWHSRSTERDYGPSLLTPLGRVLLEEPWRFNPATAPLSRGREGAWKHRDPAYTEKVRRATSS